MLGRARGRPAVLVPSGGAHGFARHTIHKLVPVTPDIANIAQRDRAWGKVTVYQVNVANDISILVYTSPNWHWARDATSKHMCRHGIASEK